MPHIVLLGDSVFDNGVYSRPEPEVADHLRTLAGDTWKVSLLAVDGSTTSDVAAQIGRIPADATHVALSTGGNDALGHADLLDQQVETAAEALSLFADPLTAFAIEYAKVLNALRSTGLPIVACTVYNGNLPVEIAAAVEVAVATFDDTIQRLVRVAGFDVVELRSVCDQPEDFANPIEPSGIGGRKIAQALLDWAEATHSQVDSRRT